MLYFSCGMKMGGWVGYRYFSLFSLIALIYGCVGAGGGSDEIGQHCFEESKSFPELMIMKRECEVESAELRSN